MSTQFPLRRMALRKGDVMIGPPGRLGPSLFVGLVPIALIAWLASVVTVMIASPDPTAPYTPDPIQVGMIVSLACLAYLAVLSQAYGFFDALFSMSGWSASRIGLGLAGGVTSLAAGWALADPVATAPAMEALIAPPAQTTMGLVLLVFAVALFLPWFEEVVFRGWLQPALIDLGRSPLAAIGLIALVFAILHPGNVYAAFATGVILGALRHFTGNLIAPLIAHWLHNVVVIGLFLSLSV